MNGRVKEDPTYQCTGSGLLLVIK